MSRRITRHGVAFFVFYLEIYPSGYGPWQACGVKESQRELLKVSLIEIYHEWHI